MSRFVPLLVTLVVLPVPPLGAGAPTRWPIGVRADLAPPPELWEEVLARLGQRQGPLGYDREQMALYGRDAHRLRLFDELFRDVTAIPRFSGKLAEDLLADRADVAALVRRAYALTDVAAGRFLPLGEPPWRSELVAPDATSDSALEAILSFCPPDSSAPEGKISAANRRRWEALPEPLRLLVIRLFLAAAEARPWLAAAVDQPSLRESLAIPAGQPVPMPLLYRLAKAPFDEERLGQLATRSRASFALFEQIDRSYLAFGSAVALGLAQSALADLALEWGDGQHAATIAGFQFDTVLGVVRISGPGADVIRGPAFISLDLGGDDHYLGAQAVTVSLASPTALLVDLGGDDRYDAGTEVPALGAGLFGLGALIDRAGDDQYTVAESGLGAGWYGTGVLHDAAGDDRYEVRGRWGQGAAHAGVGLLADLAGDDTYLCASESQAMGSTLGAGILLDATGDDRYRARDDGNISALYLGQSVAMAQGVGYGRRADLGDGHSLAGGVGVLVDGAGSDDYHAQVWSQGAGYWWGLGLLEDLGGDDRYRNGKYSLGAGAHFAIGCQVDLGGDDRYNEGNTTAVNQFQGHARDGSVGISIDGDGDDSYRLHSHSGGSADLGSVGMFWDRRGDDCYETHAQTLPANAAWSGTPPLGSSTHYPPSRSFRDDLHSWGVFLDSGGKDDYRGDPGNAANDSDWGRKRDARSRGIGIDREFYDPAGQH